MIRTIVFDLSEVLIAGLLGIQEPFLNHSKYQFSSFELKQTKREPSTFQTVLTAIRREPDECLFVDDSEMNISVARSVRIQGIVFTSADELARKLDERGL